MSLELNDYGVQEMNQQEMAAVEGGSFWVSLLGGIIMIVSSIVGFVPGVVLGWGVITTGGFIEGDAANSV